MNLALSEKVITKLVRMYGVSTFCICPGGRSAPLVSLISQAQGLEMFTFFEERSAAFFALGRSRRDKRPIAIVTTSGTAVAELLPAVIEAYYSHVPLILITADRPSSYRKTGAPQSIEQVGIFSHYVEASLDLESCLDFNFPTWSGRLPFHINICFEEPLLDAEPSQLVFSDEKALQDPRLFFESDSKNKEFENFFQKVKKPICILTETPQEVRTKLQQILSYFSWPIYAEALSHLRESPELQGFILKSGETYLDSLVSQKKIDGVIRIGRRPCTRFWKDLEKKYFHLPILSVSDQSYPGIPRAETAQSFSSFFKWAQELKQREPKKPSLLSEIFEEDKKQSQNFFSRKLISPELSLIREFSQKIPKGSFLFLGNSLPIREWDRVADFSQDKSLKYEANRGVNGIDGLVSTFLGLSSPSQENWCLLGDLSCLYDLSAPWVFKQLDSRMKCFIVVINNGGGQIFRSLFKDPVFLNSHSLNFKKWAEMWSLHYYPLSKWPKTFSFSSPAVIELKVPQTGL